MNRLISGTGARFWRCAGCSPGGEEAADYLFIDDLQWGTVTAPAWWPNCFGLGRSRYSDQVL
jgi:hypothetical protein